MGKKEKKVRALHVEFQAMINLVPKLEELLGSYAEIMEAYRMHRENGGEAIPGIEKYLAKKEFKKAPDVKADKSGAEKKNLKTKEANVLKKPETEKTKNRPESLAPVQAIGTAAVALQ